MNEMLTAAEIGARFESEWVLVEEPETDEALSAQRGRVRWHSKDRDEVYRKAVELRPGRFAILYTGRIPEDSAVVLIGPTASTSGG
jgi:hypothetical protein